MSANSVYVGLVLMSPLSNQKRYEAVLNEILQYLSTKAQNINVQIQPNRFLTFYSVNGNISDQICLPLSPFYLHTCYFRLHQGFQLQEEDKIFAKISWEVLNILKENFPSKIYLHQENLELCQGCGNSSGFYTPMSQSEELRRQTSCLLSIKEEGRPLTVDELEDAWHTLQYAEKIGDVKAQSICLELIQQAAPLQIINAIKNSMDVDTLRRIADKGGDYTQLSSNKSIALELLAKIENLDSIEKNQEGNDTTLQRQLNELNQCEDDSMSMLGGTGTQNQTLLQGGNATYERPSSTRMCLFQLSESNDLNRVTLILDTLSVRSKETLHQMKKKYNLGSKLIQILKKYCNGDYGFDQTSSRHGQFQYNLLKLLILLSQDYAVFLEYLESQALDFLCQILEEGVIFAYEDALAGDQIRGQGPQNEQLYKFLRSALDMIEMAVSKQFSEYIPSIKENLFKIQQRMGKLMSKKENALLNYFIQQYSTAGTAYGTNQNIVLQEGTLMNVGYEEQLGVTNSLNQTYHDQHIQVEQLQELKTISEGLYYFAIKLQEQIQRIDALQDFNEQYEDKHCRLFFKIIGIKVAKNNVVNAPQLGERYTSEVAVCEGKEDRYQQHKKMPSKVQFRGAEALDEDRYYEKKNDYQSQKSQKEKQILVNEVDELQEFRNKIQKKQSMIPQKGNYHQANKENEPHFIGSPIKPYKKAVSGEDQQYGVNNNYKRNMLILK